MKFTISAAVAFMIILTSSSMTSNAEVRRAMNNAVTEWTFVSAREHSDPFNQVELDALFTEPSGKTLRVPAFWAGGKSWKVRYASPTPGRHAFRTECSDQTDAGLHGQIGSVDLKPFRGSNLLLKHGPVRVSADLQSFAHADGTPFFWLGDTWWMGLVKRFPYPEGFDTLANDRVKKGFTVVQIVAGLYPDMPAFDPRGANDAGYPWERATDLPDASHNPKPSDYARINPAYFDAADRRIARLVEKGLAPCIVGAWGYHQPWMGVEKLKQHWRYVVARWGAYPVFWCVAGEANLPYYLAKGFPYDDRDQVREWTQVARYLRQIDPYHRPMSIHPTGLGKLSARYSIDDQSLIDFDMLQTGHGDRGSLPDTVRTMVMSYGEKPIMPVLNSEVCYEGIMGRCHDDVQRLMFWTSILSGGCGHTYGGNGIWQMNQPGEPYGNSPHGGTYGPTPWNEAMALPGSGQLGIAKKLLVSLGVEKLIPVPDGAEYAERSRKVDWGSWIWYPEGKPNEDAPTEPRFYRTEFMIERDHPVDRVTLRLGVDDQAAVWVNGKEVGRQSGWSAPLVVDITPFVRVGSNAIAVKAENLPAPVTKNPAGLIAAIDVEFVGGSGTGFNSGSSWKCSKAEEQGWKAVGFGDGNWKSSMELGSLGMAPWGNIDASDSPYTGPYVADLPGGVRIVYLPHARPVTLKGLPAGGVYRAYWWNPVNGKKTPILQNLPETSGGNWTSPPPPARGQDWVLAIQSSGG